MDDCNLSIDAINELDERTFHQIYCAYFRVLVAYAMQITEENEISQDIVQDVFSTLWERKIAFMTPSSFKAYLYNSVRNAALDYIRHQHVKDNYAERIATENPVYESNGEEPTDVFNQEEIYRQLFKAIDELPARCREVFLQYMKGKKNEEIAEALHISIETVKTQKKRGLTALRKKLGDSEFLFLLFFLL